ncbi:MAG: hypothetical protein M3198_09565 [Actinomycetota bacterium]|nr:hypothetical protein [Actinomycetota bacterium]
MQPLNGCVVQPFQGREFNVYGSPLGDVASEATELLEVERDLIRWVGRGLLLREHLIPEDPDGLLSLPPAPT